MKQQLEEAANKEWGKKCPDVIAMNSFMESSFDERRRWIQELDQIGLKRIGSIFAKYPYFSNESLVRKSMLLFQNKLVPYMEKCWHRFNLKHCKIGILVQI